MTKTKSTHVGKTIQFPKDNMYFYGQDMSTFQSIPSSIVFDIDEKLQTKKYMLTANGYGKSNCGKNGYGNGAIFVSEEIVSEIIAKTEKPPFWEASYHDPFITINGEPLSTKQLYEIITSKNTTIDTTLTRNGELINTLKHIRKLLKVGHYDQAMEILDEIC